MRKNFDFALETLFQVEGGIADDPNDPGGWTNFGISWGFAASIGWTKERHRAITREQAAELYREHFWEKCYADDLPSGLDLVVFDMAVNSGSRTAVRGLQKSMGVASDGIIGPVSLGRVHSLGIPTALVWFLAWRSEFYRGNSLWYLYGTGWTRRLFTLAMAAATLREKESNHE